MIGRSFYRLILTCLVMAVVSCASNHNDPRRDIVEVTGFWRPYLLYLTPSPCDRLYVEVDAVKGSEPDASRLQKLREFLARHCHKPGGIEIVLDDVIPVEEAQGVSHATLARRHVDGPSSSSRGSRTAFMYVLYFDGALCDKTPEPPPKAERESRHNPHVNFLPYPAAMFINTRYAGMVMHHVADDLLLHETGHLLGLSRRADGASAHHCLNPECLMNARIAVHMWRLLMRKDPVKQHQLCESCVAELAAAGKQTTSPKMRFVGPVLVRSEAGYHVLSLPSHMKLLVGPLTEQACRDYAAEVRERTRKPDDQRLSTGYIAETIGSSKAVRLALDRAKNDPYVLVREAATHLEKAIESD
ncbi:MAG: hypothetical protein R3F13_11855 [Prosthecobacter sp.]